MSVVETDRYRRAFSAYALGQPLNPTQTAVLEQGRQEAALPPGRYPIPCAPASDTPQRSETATERIDGPPRADPTPHLRRPTRRTPWGTDGSEER